MHDFQLYKQIALVSILQTFSGVVPEKLSAIPDNQVIMMVEGRRIYASDPILTSQVMIIDDMLKSTYTDIEIEEARSYKPNKKISSQSFSWMSFLNSNGNQNQELCTHF